MLATPNIALLRIRRGALSDAHTHPRRASLPPSLDCCAAPQIAPETAIKLTLNDWLKHNMLSDPHDISPWQRLVFGGVSGAVGQVRRWRDPACAAPE